VALNRKGSYQPSQAVIPANAGIHLLASLTIDLSSLFVFSSFRVFVIKEACNNNRSLLSCFGILMPKPAADHE